MNFQESATKKSYPSYSCENVNFTVAFNLPVLKRNILKNTVILLLTIAVIFPAKSGIVVNGVKISSGLADTTSHSENTFLYRFTESFESHPDFSSSFSPWQLLDIDGDFTWGIGGTTFPGQYEPMSFMVFNPTSTEPPLTSAAIQARSGEKFAACFASNAEQNDDWLITPALFADSATTLSFWVKSFTSQFGLERFRVGISVTDTLPESFTIISGANYLTAPADDWQNIIFDLNAYNGQRIYIGIQCISDNSFIFMLDDFSFTTYITRTNTLTGLVTDAFNGKPVSGATISVSGQVTTTDANGNYFVSSIPFGSLEADFTASNTSGPAPLAVSFTEQSSEGTHTLICSKEGYLTYSNKRIEIPPGETLQLNISLSPVLNAGAVRFVLNWGAFPADLDSHLVTPEIDGQSYHLFYDNAGNDTSTPFAKLDFDVLSGFGPETMTIYKRYAGTYKYYVHNFSEAPSITVSGAVLQIYDSTGLLHTLKVPSAGNGLYWYVGDLEGTTAGFTLKNQLLQYPPAPAKGISKRHGRKSPDSRLKNPATWYWDFGDGSTSGLKDPVHTYLNNGTYNVSLTVTSYTAQSSVTKEGLIQAGVLGNQSNIPVPEVTIYPVPAERYLMIGSDEKIVAFTIFDQKGIEILQGEAAPGSQRINIEPLEPGVYTIRIRTAKGQVTKAFIIN